MKMNNRVKKMRMKRRVKIKMKIYKMKTMKI